MFYMLLLMYHLRVCKFNSHDTRSQRGEKRDQPCRLFIIQGILHIFGLLKGSEHNVVCSIHHYRWWMGQHYREGCIQRMGCEWLLMEVGLMEARLWNILEARQM